MVSAIVCGGRAYADKSKLYIALDRAIAKFGIDTVIEGGATGADTLAREFALERKLSVIEFRADWGLGNRAGPVRNMMLLAQKPDMVIAFPGQNGTAHMIKCARTAGVTVYEIK